MAAAEEFESSSALKHSDHMLLDQSLIRVPNELLRNNFRAAHLSIEAESANLKASLKDAARSSADGRATPDATVKTLDAEIARLYTVRAKLSAKADEEASLHRRISCRAAHFDKLIALQTIGDAGYSAWSRTRLDLLIVDYLLRHGWTDSAHALVAERHLEDMVDLDAISLFMRIRKSILDGSVTEALQWVIANRRVLKKMDSKLEFLLRMQQFIELVRHQTYGKIIEATSFARKHLLPFNDRFGKEIQQAFALLCCPFKPFGNHVKHRELWNAGRWNMLAFAFTETYHKFLSLPAVPLLHIALSSGLSALKTYSCSSADFAGLDDPGDDTSDDEDPNFQKSNSGELSCPVCSTDLHELARHVPCAHYSRSYIESDQMLLPNGRSCSLWRLQECGKRHGYDPRIVKDPYTGDVFPISALKKIFIS